MLFPKLHTTIEKFEESCKQFLNEPLFPHIGIKQKLEVYKELHDELTIGESEYIFVNIEEEIKYFKNDKPEFIKYGFFYERINEIEKNRPFGEKKYYKKVLKSMKKEFELMKDNILYFRSGGTEKDQVLFSKISPDNYIFGMIKALYMVEKYLIDKDEISPVQEIIESRSPLKWTGSFSQYTELLNGIDELKVINNGNVTLTQLNIHFGKMLNVNVRDIHSGTNEILGRKEPARFGLSLVDAIYNKKDQLIEKDIARRKKSSSKR